MRLLEAAMLTFTQPISSGMEVYLPNRIDINNISNITGQVSLLSVIFLIDNPEHKGSMKGKSRTKRYKTEHN